MGEPEAMGALHEEGWDCHAHLFGPYARYPLAGARSYTPPEAVQADYQALLGRLGLGRGVLVHPSAYGRDYSLVLDTLRAQPRWRGVLVAAEFFKSWRDVFPQTRNPFR